LAQRNIRLYLTGLVLGLVAFGQASFFYWGVLQSLAAAGILIGVLYLLSARKIVLLFTGFLSLAGYYFFHPYAIYYRLNWPEFCWVIFRWFF